MELKTTAYRNVGPADYGGYVGSVNKSAASAYAATAQTPIQTADLDYVLSVGEEAAAFSSGVADVVEIGQSAPPDTRRFADMLHELTFSQSVIVQGAFSLNQRVADVDMARVKELASMLDRSVRINIDAPFEERAMRQEESMQLARQIADELMSGSRATRFLNSHRIIVFGAPGRETWLDMESLIRDAAQGTTDFSQSTDVSVSELAALMEKGTNTAQSMPNSTVQERALQREATLRMAQEIADSLMSGVSAEVFLTEVQRRVNNDAMRERGYWQDESGNYTHRPFASGTTLFRPPSGGNWHIPTINIMIAERQFGVSREEFFDIQVRGSSRPGTMFHDPEAWARRLELQAKIDDYLFSNNDSWERFNSFGRQFETWRSNEERGFLAVSEPLGSAMDAATRAFDMLISSQEFNSINTWMQSAQDLLQRMLTHLFEQAGQTGN
ncbi:MAG: hypothetical protein FWB97_07680 [Oscillospiraceae bacterium]|nr:hypothetical protein [Oscillospiraceae bacterium]